MQKTHKLHQEIFDLLIQEGLKGDQLEKEVQSFIMKNLDWKFIEKFDLENPDAPKGGIPIPLKEELYDKVRTKQSELNRMRTNESALRFLHRNFLNLDQN
ncbi:hypothetical protein [Flammeovirga agarivorans]|uniref:Uncharacterized protein n=1 Tax=Flammeovirga agarivorans TaxID=2726742 RepID=A0A7X8SGT9_9BACT|nr:hypothetical protein [Flammeovirga agarivorans]NLR89924.1 hypothetical protein [Flammeovirga agarivorans]